MNSGGPGGAGHSIELVTDELVLELQHSIPVSVYCECSYICVHFCHILFTSIPWTSGWKGF